MNLFRDNLDVEKILRLRSSQYVQPLYVEDIVGAGLTKSTPLPSKILAAFMMYFMPASGKNRPRKTAVKFFLF